ncbi:MAG: hypothetical protein AB7O26_17815 [Planctomycetaceae bacterium]
MAAESKRMRWVTPAFAVAIILLLLGGLVLLRDYDPLERILAPFLNSLGLNG